MNAIETAENIVACRMTSIDEVLTMAVKPESLEAVKQLIRIQLDIAIGEAMTAVIDDFIQDGELPGAKDNHG
jgi:hypothetical protein